MITIRIIMRIIVYTAPHFIHYCLYIVAPCIDFFGMISEQTGTGCSRLRRRVPSILDVCAYVGDRIQFKCTLAVEKDETTVPLISSPERTVIITGFVIEASVDIDQNTTSGEYNCSLSTVHVSTNGPVYRAIKVEVFGKYNSICSSLH